MIHCDERPEGFRNLIDDSRYMIVLVIGRAGLQLPVQSGGCAQTPGLVDIEADQNPLACFDRDLLFPEREQQILGKPPVKERADRRDLLDCQYRKLVQLDKRSGGCGNQTIFRILIDEYGYKVADPGVLRNLVLRQQDTIRRILVEPFA